MNYHVFVVNSTTFKCHLEYMFAGIGADDKQVPFLSDTENISLHSTTERNLVGMIADISKICIGDKVLFYLQSEEQKSGMFFGVFKVISQPFFDENNSNHYLKNELQKSLTFRILIAPDEVYLQGVSEHEYLDSLDGIEYPYQMCWSLIYRKLKGNRGCTMITKFEYEWLKTKLQNVNNNNFYEINDIEGLTFNSITWSIELIAQNNQYLGQQNSLDIRDRLLFKANRRNTFEVHLQAYILQHIRENEILKNLLLSLRDNDYWIGNEVSCGVGMQRIDIMIIQERNNDVYLKIVELKCVIPEMYILKKQLPWYIKWVRDYIVPNYISQGKTIHIIPCVIALHTENVEFIAAAHSFSNNFNANDNIVFEPLQYISVAIHDDISFHNEL